MPNWLLGAASPFLLPRAFLLIRTFLFPWVVAPIFFHLSLLFSLKHLLGVTPPIITTWLFEVGVAELERRTIAKLQIWLERHPVATKLFARAAIHLASVAEVRVAEHEACARCGINTFANTYIMMP